MRGGAAAVAVAALAALAVAACGASSPAAATKEPPPTNVAVTVDIHNIAFIPKSVTVRAGQTVAWKFDDGSIPHNVVAADWRSPDRTSGYYTHTFATPGTYSYRCTIHSGMDGQVVVTP